MSFLDQIAACYNAELSQFHPFMVNGQQYGYLLPHFANVLATWPDVFQVKDNTVHLHPDLTDYASRTAAVMLVMRDLHQQGIIPTWVGENYAVTKQFGAPAVFELERAAASYFGIRNFGVHLNGLVKTSQGVYVWVGTRARDKPLWPGQLDQIAAGGQPVGIGLYENIQKEAQEEAAIPISMSQHIELVSEIYYCQQSSRGLDNATIFAFDLWLPEDFTPINQDGEVEHFQLLSLKELAYLTASTQQFKDNCNLVNIDLLLRLGMINTSDLAYSAIQSALQTKRISNNAYGTT